jgi:hypothetical protein
MRTRLLPRFAAVLSARGGVRFSAGYVTAPICAPSRMGLLTSVYQQRLARKFHTLLDGGATLCEVAPSARQPSNAFRAIGKTAWRFCF